MAKLKGSDVLKVVLHDVSSGRYLCERFDSEKLFASEIDRAIFEAAKRYYQVAKEDVPPARSYIEAELQTAGVQLPWIAGYLDELYSDERVSSSYVIKHLEDTIRRIRLQTLLSATVDTLQQPDADVSEVVSGLSSELHLLLKDLTSGRELGIELRQVERHVSVEQAKISTGYEWLDDVLRGGLGVGEVGIVQGVPGSGKSMFLIAMGAEAFKVGHRVLHITLELSAQRTLQRYDAYLLNKPTVEIAKLAKEDPQVLKEALERYDGVLVVSEFPTGVLAPQEIRGLILQYIDVVGDKPDLIVLDYIGLLRAYSVELRYISLGLAIQELRHLAGEFDLAIWTAHQSRRSAVGHTHVTMEDIADSFELVRVADVVLSIGTTEGGVADASGGEWTLTVNKNRNAKAGSSWSFKPLFERARLFPQSEVERTS